MKILVTIFLTLYIAMAGHWHGSNGNIIKGSWNNLRGSGNKLFGDKNNINGNHNIHIGFDSNIFGSGNKIVGVGHNIQGNGIHMFGPTAHPSFYNFGNYPYPITSYSSRFC